MWRCWICSRCRIVSYHPRTYCPNCPDKMVKVEDTSDNLARRFPCEPSQWTPAEWDSNYEQPWHRK